MEVAAQYVQNFAPTIPPPPSLPFVPWGKWAARIFHAVPPHVFREKFPETKVIEVDLELLGRLSYPPPRFAEREINSPLGKFRSRTLETNLSSSREHAYVCVVNIVILRARILRTCTSIEVCDQWYYSFGDSGEKEKLFLTRYDLEI